MGYRFWRKLTIIHIRRGLGLAKSFQPVVTVQCPEERAAYPCDAIYMDSGTDPGNLGFSRKDIVEDKTVLTARLIEQAQARDHPVASIFLPVIRPILNSVFSQPSIYFNVIRRPAIRSMLTILLVPLLLFPALSRAAGPADQRSRTKIMRKWTPPWSRTNKKTSQSTTNPASSRAPLSKNWRAG